MHRVLFFLFLPFYLFSLDSDFDGVDDAVDACLETGILELVSANGCSDNQESKLDITLLQSYAYIDIDIDENNNIDNYSLALLLSKETWLLYVGSGYLKYDNLGSTISDFGDTTILIQKTFPLTTKHYLKFSLSTVLPTYNDESNKVDYGMDIAYSYIYKKINLELGYQYDWINDTNSQDLQTLYLYLGYALSNSLHTVIGYNNDSTSRISKTFAFQYLYSDNILFSYSFAKGENNFYDTIHSLGLGYSF